MRQGKIFSLNPCVWIFAGTNLDSDQEKMKDFQSRMTMIEKIDYASLKEMYLNKEDLAIEARLEQVYLGAIMIRKYFSDMQYVSKGILTQFRKQEPSEAPARKIQRLVASLNNVQYGKVTKENCRNWGDLKWEKGDDELVKLVF